LSVFSTYRGHGSGPHTFFWVFVKASEAQGGGTSVLVQLTESEGDKTAFTKRLDLSSLIT